MQLTATKLWNRNFIMLAIGQVVSLFGNAILRFALPMYILLESGSPELMGRVLALAVIPMIIISPFGGALADRVNKKRLIVFLDFFTAAGAFAYLWAIGALSVVPVTIVMLMLLISINGMMSAATDSSYPLIVPQDQLVRANSVAMAVNTLAMMLGPVLGGILLVEFGLTSLLLVGGICFALAAIMETFIRIPSVKQESSRSFFKIITGDISDGIHFAVKSQPILAKILLVIVMIQFVVASFGHIGIPVLIIQNLGMDERMVGIAMGFIGAGGIIGGILSGILGPRVRIQKGHWILFALGVCLIPMGLVFFLQIGVIVSFATIAAMMFASMVVVTLFTIQMMTFIQRITPSELLGKMMGLVMTATVLAQPLGQWVYGILFERLNETPWIIIFSASFLTAMIALWSRKHWKSIPSAFVPAAAPAAGAAAPATAAAASLPQIEVRHLTAVINSNSYLLRVKMELVHEQHIELNGVQNINVSCKDTNISLFKSNVPSLIIKEYKSMGRGNCYFNVVNSGGEINITEGQRPLFFGSLKYIKAVYLPEKFTGNISLKTGNGHIQLNDNFTFNSLIAESQDGHIKVNEITSQNIKLQTSAGKVQCGKINGNIKILTEDGGIFIDRLAGNIIARAHSGKIKCTVTRPLRKILLAADDGSVTLNIPRNLYFRFIAKTGGRISTPFVDKLFRPAACGYTYQGIIGKEKKSNNEATDIKIAVKDYKIAVNWID